MLLQWSQATFNETIKAANVSYKIKWRTEAYCHGNSCASAPPTFFKAWYVILKAYKETEYVDLCYFISLCDNIYTKLLGTQKKLGLLWLACIEYINTTPLTFIDVNDVMVKNALYTQVLTLCY